MVGSILYSLTPPLSSHKMTNRLRPPRGSTWRSCRHHSHLRRFTLSSILVPMIQSINYQSII